MQTKLWQFNGEGQLRRSFSQRVKLFRSEIASSHGIPGSLAFSQTAKLPGYSEESTMTMK